MKTERNSVTARKENADLAVELLAKAARALNQIPEEKMTFQDIINMIKVAVPLERISRGLPSRLTGDETEYSELISVEELQEIIRDLKEKAYC